MARDLITPIKTTDMSTGFSKLSTDKMVLISTANGAYIETSGLNPTKFVFFCMRSSKSTKNAYIYVRAGSTAGAEDFEQGKYSTGRDFVIKIPHSTRGLSGKSTNGASSHGSSFTPTDPVIFVIQDTARFLDTNRNINFDFSTAMSSGGGTSHRSYIGALYVG
jgi:hypothetical protein